MKVLAATLMLAWLVSTNASIAEAIDRDHDADRLSQLINGYRAQHGRKSLVLDDSLSALAREHAIMMRKDGRLSHDGFQQRFAKARSPHCVENVVASGTVHATFDAWRGSPVHDHNLLDPGVSRMGIGIDGRYVTFFACR